MSASISLDPKLDTSNAIPLIDLLLDHRGSDVVLDLSQTTQIGALCAQALLAARQEWVASGHNFELVSVPANVVRQFEVLGISPITLTARDAA